MSPPPEPDPIKFAALLSAANASEAPMIVGGEPVLVHQIAALRSVGVRKFLIEVDSVPGSLLAMADRLCLAGNSVDFVRSVHNLQTKLGENDVLVVQAEGVYFAPEFLRALLGRSDVFISTVDNRDENEAFERMDLNTRWAGLAVVPTKTVTNVGKLPDGWSMTSSLLRQAMQDGVPQRSVKQGKLQKGELRRVDRANDAEMLTSEMMRRRARREPGAIEAQIFAPIAAKIASVLWKVKSRSALADGSALLLGAAAFGLAGFGFALAAAVVAFGAIAANSVRLALGNAEPSHRIAKWMEMLLWLSLAGALLLATGANGYQASDGLFAGGIVSGLTLLARQLRLPIWAQKTLQSPALIALLLLVAIPFSGVAVAAMTVATLQLLLLILAKWNHNPST